MSFAEHAGITVESSGEGRSRLVLDAGPDQLNAHGTVHGGAIATLCDTAMGRAVVAAGGESPVTIEMKVTYLEPGQQGRLVAEAVVRKRGKRITIVECEVTQPETEGGDLIALSLATFATTG